jgi:hypothetical protein
MELEIATAAADFQADDEGSIPFTRSNVFKGLDGNYTPHSDNRAAAPSDNWPPFVRAARRFLMPAATLAQGSLDLPPGSQGQPGRRHEAYGQERVRDREELCRVGCRDGLHVGRGDRAELDDHFSDDATRNPEPPLRPAPG